MSPRAPEPPIYSLWLQVHGAGGPGLVTFSVEQMHGPELARDQMQQLLRSAADGLDDAELVVTPINE